MTSTVGVVVTTYNHAHFLDEALASVFGQHPPPDAVVVVDDGSSDDPAAVVRRFPGAQLIRQQNRGLAAARNAGWQALEAEFVLFLDADDRLEPRALEAALRCFARVPECGFVYGGHRYIDRDGRSIGERYEPPGDIAFEHLLRGNFIAMHGTVLYRRARLLEVGGFDESLPRCEDYDLYLRMTKRYAIAGYADLVAAYRLHGENMSSDYSAMLRAVLEVHARHRPDATAGPRALDAWREGRRAWREYLRPGARLRAIPIAHLVYCALDQSAGGARASIAGGRGAGSGSWSQTPHRAAAASLGACAHVAMARRAARQRSRQRR